MMNERHSSSGTAIVFVFLAYRDPDYARAHALLAGLERITRLHVVKLFNTTPGVLRYIEVLFRYLLARLKQRPDAVVICFRGLELFFLLKPLLPRNTKVIFDELVSPYLALRDEGKAGAKGVWFANVLRPLEKFVLTSADVVLVDTEEHKRVFAVEFRIPISKFAVVPVGAIEVNEGRAQDVPARFSVLFYGSFVPLHGAEQILEAAKRLSHLPVDFLLIGGGRRGEKLVRDYLAQDDRLRIRHIEHAPYRDLLEKYIPQADLCLGGPFGATLQAMRVVTSKTVQCLALRKPTVIGNSHANVGFEDRRNCLLVEQGNPGALAEAIEWAYANRSKLSTLGKSGFALYEQVFSVARSSVILSDVLAGIHVI